MDVTRDVILGRSALKSLDSSQRWCPPPAYLKSKVDAYESLQHLKPGTRSTFTERGLLYACLSTLPVIDK